MGALRQILRARENPIEQPGLRTCRWRFRYLRYGIGGRVMFLRRNLLHLANEAIAATGQCLDESGIYSFVSKCFADAIYGRVHAVFVVDHRSLRPQLPADFLPRQQLARPVQKQEKELQGLGVQLDTHTLAAKLSARRICFKDAESIEHFFVNPVGCGDSPCVAFPSSKSPRQLLYAMHLAANAPAPRWAHRFLMSRAQC